MIKIDRQRAEDVATEALREYGISEPSARQTAKVLVSADAREKHSHGLLRLPRFIRGIEHGNVDPEGTINVVSERGGAATIDGGSRLGPVAASAAITEAMDRADEFGISAVGVHNSNHLGMLGYYTDQLLQNGFIAIGITNTEPAMPPYGGTEPILGTNPIAIGMPTEPVFNLDMSTSAVARGTILHCDETGEELPEGVALNEDGQPTTDPEAALDGTVLPFGEKKGSGLAVAVEVLAGALVGAEMGTDVTGTYNTEDPCTKGDLFIAIDPISISTENFVQQASTFFTDLIEGEPASYAEEIRLPGQRSVERDRTATSIEIDEDLWKKIRAFVNTD